MLKIVDSEKPIIIASSQHLLNFFPLLTQFAFLIFRFLLQLLLILTAVQIIGAIASFTNINELWAVYSVTQGVQVRFEERLAVHIIEA